MPRDVLEQRDSVGGDAQVACDFDTGGHGGDLGIAKYPDVFYSYSGLGAPN
jgi:hypothetical protein